MKENITDKVLGQLKTLYPNKSFGVAFSPLENVLVIKTDDDTELDKNDLGVIERLFKGKVFSDEIIKRGKPYKDTYRKITIKGYFKNGTTTK